MALPQLDILPPAERERIEEATAIIEAVRLLARPEILKTYGTSSCIESARVVLEVLKRYELSPSRCIAATVRVFNSQMVARVAREGQPTTTEQVMRWSEEDGSWNVGIGATGEESPGRWDGHLVALCMNRVLIDVSLDQASRPERNIELAPVAVTVPDGWLDGEPLTFVENGCAVVYRAEPDNRSWLKHGAWTAPSPGHKEARKRTVDGVCVKVERWLKDA